MAKPFMDEDFLLQTPTARTLYHEYAAPQLILDYHCHLPAEEIAKNIRFRNITELWLGGDHYKWRFMRSAGVAEDFVTGDQPDQEKFRRFCAVLPLAVGNPLYHWCHLELRRFSALTPWSAPKPRTCFGKPATTGWKRPSSRPAA